MRPFAAGIGAALAPILVVAARWAPQDPLPSWNARDAKHAILAFVEDVTDPDSPRHRPRSERIAVFDNDGTLWCEQPAYFQLAFAVDRVKALAPEHPEWSEAEPFRSILAGDLSSLARGGEKAVAELVARTHSGVTTDEFDRAVRDWIATARHPGTGRLYKEMVYQPMLEVLGFLRSRGFETYIVSGGGVDFLRAFAEDLYGIPPEQVVGSRGKYELHQRDGVPVLVKQPQVDHIDDGPGKPVGIQQVIGRRPIAAFGNSDGDFEMLSWTTTGDGPRFGAIVHHDDGEREFAYDRDSKIGKLSRALDAAPVHGWTVISMKEDWTGCSRSSELG